MMDAKMVEQVSILQTILAELNALNEPAVKLNGITYMQVRGLAKRGKETLHALRSLVVEMSLKTLLHSLGHTLTEVSDVLMEKHEELLTPVNKMEVNKDVSKYMGQCKSSMKGLEALYRSNKEHFQSDTSYDEMLRSLSSSMAELTSRMNELASDEQKESQPKSRKKAKKNNGASTKTSPARDPQAVLDLQMQRLMIRDQWFNLSQVMIECLECMTSLAEQQRSVDKHDHATPFRRGPAFGFGGGKSFHEAKQEQADMQAEMDRRKKQELGVFTLVAQSQSNMKKIQQINSELRSGHKGVAFGKRPVAEEDEKIATVIKRKATLDRAKKRKTMSSLRNKSAHPGGLADVNMDTIKEKAPGFTMPKADVMKDDVSLAEPENETHAELVRRRARLRKHNSEANRGPGMYTPSFAAVEKAVVAPKLVPPTEVSAKKDKPKEVLGPGIYAIQEAFATTRPRIPSATTVAARPTTVPRMSKAEKDKIAWEERRARRKKRKEAKANAEPLTQADIWLRELAARDSERGSSDDSDMFDESSDEYMDGKDPSSVHPAKLKKFDEYEPDPFAALSTQLAKNRRAPGTVILPEPSKDRTVENIRAGIKERRRVEKARKAVEEHAEKIAVQQQLKKEGEREARIEFLAKQSKRTREAPFVQAGGSAYQGPLMFPDDTLVTPFHKKAVFKYTQSVKAKPSARRRWYLRKQKAREAVLAATIAKKNAVYEEMKKKNAEAASEPFDSMLPGRPVLKKTVDRRVYNPNYSYFDKDLPAYEMARDTVTRFPRSENELALEMGENIDGDVLLLEPGKAKDSTRGHTWQQAIAFDGGVLSDSEIDYKEKRRRDYRKAKEDERRLGPVMTELDLSVDPRKKNAPAWDFGKLAARSVDFSNDPNLMYYNEDNSGALYYPKVGATSTMGANQKLTSFVRAERGLDKKIEKSKDQRLALDPMEADANVRASTTKGGVWHKFSAREEMTTSLDPEEGILILEPERGEEYLKAHVPGVTLDTTVPRFEEPRREDEPRTVLLPYGKIDDPLETRSVVSFGKQTGREVYDFRSGIKPPQDQEDVALLNPSDPAQPRVKSVVNMAGMSGRFDHEFAPGGAHPYAQGLDGKDDRMMFGADVDLPFRKPVTGSVRFEHQMPREDPNLFAATTEPEEGNLLAPNHEAVDPHTRGVIFDRQPRFPQTFADEFDEEQTLMLFPSDDVNKSAPKMTSFSKAPRELKRLIQQEDEQTELNVQKAYDATHAKIQDVDFGSAPARFHTPNDLELDAEGDQFLLFPQKGDEMGKSGPQFSFYDRERSFSHVKPSPSADVNQLNISESFRATQDKATPAVHFGDVPVLPGKPLEKVEADLMSARVVDSLDIRAASALRAKRIPGGVFDKASRGMIADPDPITSVDDNILVLSNSDKPTSPSQGFSFQKAKRFPEVSSPKQQRPVSSSHDSDDLSSSNDQSAQDAAKAAAEKRRAELFADVDTLLRAHVDADRKARRKAREASRPKKVQAADFFSLEVPLTKLVHDDPLRPLSPAKKGGKRHGKRIFQQAKDDSDVSLSSIDLSSQSSKLDALIADLARVNLSEYETRAPNLSSARRRQNETDDVLSSLLGDRSEAKRTKTVRFASPDKIEAVRFIPDDYLID